jgi:hypothetical protein
MSNVLNTIGRTIERFGKAMRVFSEAGDKQLNRAQSPTPPSWSSQPDSWHAQSTLSTRHAGATTWVPQSPLNERPVALHFEGELQKDDEETEQGPTGRDPLDSSVDQRYVNLDNCQKDANWQGRLVQDQGVAGRSSRDFGNAGFASDPSAPRPEPTNPITECLKVMRQKPVVFKELSERVGLKHNPYRWH